MHAIKSAALAEFQKIVPNREHKLGRAVWKHWVVTDSFSLSIFVSEYGNSVIKRSNGQNQGPHKTDSLLVETSGSNDGCYMMMEGNSVWSSKSYGRCGGTIYLNLHGLKSSRLCEHASTKYSHSVYRFLGPTFHSGGELTGIFETTVKSCQITRRHVPYYSTPDSYSTPWFQTQKMNIC
jgi:hypothetical protein